MKRANIQRSNFLAITLAITLFSSQKFASAQEDLNQGESINIVSSILKDPALEYIDENRIRWEQFKNGQIMVPEENPNHPEGIFWNEKFNIAKPIGNPPRIYAFSEPQIRILKEQKTPLTEEDLRQKALQFLQRQFSWFFHVGNRLDFNALGPDWFSQSRKGTWYFRWQQLDQEGLPSATADVYMRAIDGKVVGFSIRKRDWPKHETSLLQAENLALQIASKSKDVGEIVISSAIVLETGDFYTTSGLPKTIFRLNLKGKDKKTGTEKLSVFHVDADTCNPVWIDQRSGEATPKIIVWRGNPQDEKKMAAKPVSARLPVWTNKRLVFSASQDLLGVPAWVNSPSQIFLRDENGKINYVTSDLGDGQEAISISSQPDSSWCAIQCSRRWAYAVDLKTGQYRVIGTPARPIDTIALNSDGNWAIASTTGHTGNPDTDLFADDLNRGPAVGLRERLVLPDSEEHDPIFSVDNNWLYFISTKQGKEHTIHALCRISAALAQAKQLLHLKSEQIETIIPSLPDEVARMSIFPNGQKLLLQMGRGLAAVDLATRKVTSIKLPILKDAEIGNVAIEAIQDGWAGPSDDEITFSGQTIDGLKQVRRRIYSCHLDGSSLRAWTPKDNGPVPAYIFPATKKTTYDVSKAMIIGEIDWEEANRDH